LKGLHSIEKSTGKIQIPHDKALYRSATRSRNMSGKTGKDAASSHTRLRHACAHTFMFRNCHRGYRHLLDIDQEVLSLG